MNQFISLPVNIVKEILKTYLNKLERGEAVLIYNKATIVTSDSGITAASLTKGADFLSNAGNGLNSSL